MAEAKDTDKSFVYLNSEKRSIFYDKHRYNFEKENDGKKAKEKKKLVTEIDPEKIDKEKSIRWRCVNCKISISTLGDSVERQPSCDHERGCGEIFAVEQDCLIAYESLKKHV